MKVDRSLWLFGSGFAAVLAFGWAAFPKLLYRTEPQPIQFSHKVHVEKAGMKCGDCHPIRPDGRFAGIPSVSSCAGCHAQQMGTTEAEKKLVATYVTPNREIPWRVYARQPDNVFFPHAAHVKLAGLGCDVCHGAHGATDGLGPFQLNRVSGYSRDIWGPSIARLPLNRRVGMKMSDCEDCHAARGVQTGCLDCHK